MHSPPTKTVDLTHSHFNVYWLNTELAPHLMQSSKTAIKSGLQTHRLVRSTNCSTLLGPHEVWASKHIPLSFNVRGGGQIQFPEASWISPFLQTQNEFESIYLVASQVRQSWSLGPLQVKQSELHFWQTISSAGLSS